MRILAVCVLRARVRIQWQTHTGLSAEGGREVEPLGTGRAGRDVEGEEGSHWHGASAWVV